MAAQASQRRNSGARWSTATAIPRPQALTLDFALRAMASRADFSSVFASLVVASGVATLAWIPGGLGAFEASCVAMLRMQGVPIEAGLAATLLLRGLTFWLPMLPGLALARRELGRSPAQ